MAEQTTHAGMPWGRSATRERWIARSPGGASRPLVTFVVVLIACRPTTGTPPRENTHAYPDASSLVTPTPSASHEVVLPNAVTDWCTEEMRGLFEGVCYFVPEEPRPELLIYLSGIVPDTPRSVQKEKVQHIVVSAAKRARAVVLLPRGRKGIGPTADTRDWWAWPTTSADAVNAEETIAGWFAARARLEEVLGLRFEKTYVAGSSSGAYFLTMLALSGRLTADGFAATSGGAPGSRSASALAPLAKPPFYVGYGSGDPSSASSARALGALLTEAKWPVRVAEHPGGHGAREEYLDEAFAFWRSAL